MAVSVKELIEQKESISKRKSRQYDLTTSIGVITIKQPTRALAAEAAQMEEGDPYLIMECVVAPDFKDKQLLEAYGCLEPTDLPIKIFESGEVRAIANKILECAGYGKDIQSAIHKEIKN